MIHPKAIWYGLRGPLFAMTLGTSSAIGVAVVVGCPGAVAPVTDCTSCGVRVFADAVAGMTILQIGSDVLNTPACAACGLDIAAIVASLLGSTDPKVQASKAYAEAIKIQAAARGVK